MVTVTFDPATGTTTICDPADERGPVTHPEPDGWDGVARTVMLYLAQGQDVGILKAATR